MPHPVDPVNPVNPVDHRRLPRAGAVGVATVLCLALTSCSGSSGGDGSASPKVAVAVGDCFVEAAAKPVPCTENHIAQTVFVSASPPPESSAALAPCREAQAEFLGQDVNTRLDVQLWEPDDRSWYRCDVLLRNSTQAGAGYQVLRESLQDALRNRVPVSYQACLDEPYDSNSDQTYLPCSEPHLAQELTIAPAIGTPDEKFPGDVSDRATQACNASAAAADQLVRNRTVDAYFPENADAWSTGERSADCWLTSRRGKLPPVSGDGG